MIELIRSLLDAAGDHAPLVLACVALFAIVDSALGIGVVVPGETGIVLAAVALSDRPGWLVAAVAAAAAGAFVGDQLGFAVGRRGGPALGDSRLVRRLGRARWDQARRQVAGRFWVVVAARLLPGVRTFVAAAAGASSMPYRRFASACGVAAVLWATLWVIGGATVGNALLGLAERASLPLVLGVVAVVVAVVIIRRRGASAEGATIPVSGARARAPRP